MSKVLQFKVFCFEIYKRANNLTGKQTQKLFQKYNVLQYIGEFYDVLHSASESYIVDDIQKFIDKRSS